MTMQKAAERAAELANAALGGIRTWEADDFSVGCVRTAFVQFIADADAAAREVQNMAKECQFSLGTSMVGKISRTLSPFILPDDVDPLLIEARRMVADLWVADTAMSRGAINDVRTGNDDSNLFVVAALTALRRGIEIAEARK